MKLATCERCGLRDVPVTPCEWRECGRDYIGVVCGDCADEVKQEGVTDGD